MNPGLLYALLVVMGVGFLLHVYGWLCDSAEDMKVGAFMVAVALMPLIFGGGQ
jgi:hypothetical protein